jgi:hypothetical protein
VSASNQRVYFRDGPTKIRYLAPDGSTGDVTTVPGGAAAVSYFSVSPDDQRIAVTVRDLSSSGDINLRLYVEDLAGGGNHADIFMRTTPNREGGTVFWPIGWHQNSLVLANAPACALQQMPSLVAFHVADANTALRSVSIEAANCTLNYLPPPIGARCIDTTNCSLSWFPSPVGAMCVSVDNRFAKLFDWTGVLRRGTPTQPADRVAGMSPSGQSLFLGTGTGPGAPPPATRFVLGSEDVTVSGHAACLWIDDKSLLAPDAVIAFPSGAVTKLPAAGTCAGRFPGLL